MKALGVGQSRCRILRGWAVALEEPGAATGVHHEVAAHVLKIAVGSLGLEERCSSINKHLQRLLHALKGIRVVRGQVNDNLSSKSLPVCAIRTAVGDVHLIIADTGAVHPEGLVCDVQEGSPLDVDSQIRRDDHIDTNMELLPMPEQRRWSVALQHVAVGGVESRGDLSSVRWRHNPDAPGAVCFCVFENPQVFQASGAWVCDDGGGGGNWGEGLVPLPIFGWSPRRCISRPCGEDWAR
mmetsp:Transcript_16974/g.49466  ORF Transcript_16974/g.49466 Transcript_16974/m.49466 type:complete len:239 (-) Transcript_16974:330-1046(-)